MFALTRAILFCVEGLLKKGTGEVVAFGDPFVTFCDPHHQNLGIAVQHPLRHRASLCGALAPVDAVFYRGFTHFKWSNVADHSPSDITVR